MKGEFLFIKAKKKLHKILLAEIIYIEAMDDYIQIKLTGEKTLVARMTMKGIMDELDLKQFIRVHRSFIVPLKNIQAVGTKRINVNGVEIALGKHYSANVIKKFKKGS